LRAIARILYRHKSFNLSYSVIIYIFDVMFYLQPTTVSLASKLEATAMDSKGMWVSHREYELLPEAHATLSVVLNCSRFSLRVFVCYPTTPAAAFPSSTPPPGVGETAGRAGKGQQQQGVGGAEKIHRERIWSSLR
jgi:hypothetical protein